jgi:hypothetical protein
MKLGKSYFGLAHKEIKERIKLEILMFKIAT